MSDNEEKSGLTVSRRQDRPPIRAGRALARRRNVPPAPAPSAPPAEATPLAWPSGLPPAEILFQSRRRRRRWFLLRLGLFSGLPTLFTLVYMLFIASPRYVAQFEVTYQAYQPPQNLATGLVQTFLGASQGSTVDLSQILYEYIRSATLLKKLDARLHLRQYYSSPKVDYLSRMNPKANNDVFLKYYLWYVSVSEGMGGYLTVDVQAFDPDFALAVAKAIFEYSDEMVDALSARARQDEVDFAKSELTRAETRVRKTRLALTDFQNLHGDLNPPGSASQLSGIVGTLESNLSTTRAQLGTLNAVAPHSPQVVATKAQIASLEAQLKHEQNRLANNAGGTPLSKVLDEYSGLLLEQQFAQSDYLSAQQGLEVARADAARKQAYLIDFAPPHRPDKANIEFAVVYTLTALLISLVVFGIGSLLGGAMRDHAGV